MSTRVYLVHGADRDSGDEVKKLLEANSAAEAERAANRLGILVKGVEIHAESHESVTAHARKGARESNAYSTEERTIWSGSPSQWSNIWTFAFCALTFWLVIPVLIAAYQYLLTKHSRLTLTTQRFRMEWGIVGKHVEEVELYRVRDTSYSQSFVERLLRLGTITLVTSDARSPRVSLRSIQSPAEVRELFRENIERMRERKRVRDIDVS